MFNLYGHPAMLATGAVMGVMLGKFLVPHEVSVAEAVLYSTIGVLIVGYWCAQAFLRIYEKRRTETPDGLAIEESVEALEKQIATHNSKINALLLRAGLSAVS